MYIFMSMVCLVLYRVYSSQHPLPLMGKPCTNFPAWGKLFNGAYHAVRLSVMRVFGNLLGSLDFLGHRKSWPRGSYVEFSCLGKTNRQRKPQKFTQIIGFFFSFQANLRGAKVGLLSWLHFSHLGKYCVHGVLSHPFFLDGKYLAPTFLQWEKPFHWCSKNLLLMVSYSYPMFLFGSKC